MQARRSLLHLSGYILFFAIGLVLGQNTFCNSDIDILYRNGPFFC